MRLVLEGYTESEVYGYILAGLMSRHVTLTEKIADIKEQMGAATTAPARRGRKPVAAKPTATRKAAAKAGRRELSPEARKRIADAQHKRWANVKKAVKKTRGQKLKLAEPMDEAQVETQEMEMTG